MKLTIIIPVYNEINSIEILLKKVLETKVQKQIIVVDDYSLDGTREKIIKNFKSKIDNLILHKYNQGKGAAIRSAQQYVNGDYVLIQDADLEYDPNEYNELINPFITKNADVVLGSRFKGDRPERLLNFHHRIANFIITFIVNIFTNINFSDVETCYKVFKKEHLKNFSLKENGFAIEIELIMKLSKLKLRIFEVGISYSGRTYEQGKKIKLRDAFGAIYSIIKYKIIKN